jgi:hypothetical protein
MLQEPLVCMTMSQPKTTAEAPRQRWERRRSARSVGCGGIAETAPSFDVDYCDATVMVRALATTLTLALARNWCGRRADHALCAPLFREALWVAHLEGYRGILNSTTSLILTEMEYGNSFKLTKETMSYTKKNRHKQWTGQAKIQACKLKNLEASGGCVPPPEAVHHDDFNVLCAGNPLLDQG